MNYQKNSRYGYTLKKTDQGNNGFTLIEINVSILLIGIILGLSAITFQRAYAAQQLKIYSYQLVNDIRYIQQQSMMNLGGDLQYKIKFRSKYLANGNTYQIWRGDIQQKKEVKLPKTIEMDYGGKGKPFSPDPVDPNIKVLAYKATGEISTNTGTVNLRDKVNNKAVGIIVHKLRVRIGAPNEVDG